MLLMANNCKFFLLVTILAAYCYSLGENDYSDTCSASQNPPGGLTVAQAPMFVVLGFDDNGYSGLNPSVNDGGMTWATDFFSSKNNPPGEGNSGTFDGEQCKVSFYFTTQYIDTWTGSAGLNKKSWRTAMDKGHEVGNHTHDHADGSAFSVSQWEEQIQICQDWLKKPYDPNESSAGDKSKGIGVQDSDLYGFRTPFLKYNNNTFTVVINKGFRYDCSIEEGWQNTHDGTNYNWPYTLHNGSPGHTFQYTNGMKDFAVSSHNGLWEMPCYPIIIPPDDKCNEYGVNPGLRAKLHAVFDQIELETGKIRGLDYDMFVDAKMTKAEFLACLKYSFDLRYNGNRSPMVFGTHSDQYATNADGWEAPNATVAERQQAIEEFIIYALTKEETRVVSAKQLMDWMRDPVALEGTFIQNNSFIQDKMVSITVNGGRMLFDGLALGKIASIKLYSAQGRCTAVVSSVTIDKGHFIWKPESYLARGVYTVKIDTGRNKVFKRIIVLK